MRNFLATTAIAVVMATGATGAFADGHGNTFMQEAAKGDMRASEFIGMRVYAAEVEDGEAEDLRVRDNALVYNDEAREWDDIGEINDVLMTRDGNVTAVLVDVGGFLGMGEHTVAVSMDQIKFVPENDEGEPEYFLVINSTKEQLEQAPEFDTAILDGDIMDNEQAEADMTGQNVAAEAEAEVKQKTAEVEAEVKQETAEAEAEINQETAETMEAADAKMFPPTDFRVDGYEAVEVGQLTADDLDGARVYGVGDEDVGEISELLLTEDGKIEAAVIDVGGFLGIGERPVKVGFDQLSIQRQNEGGGVRVYIDASEESLEQLPEYDD